LQFDESILIRVFFFFFFCCSFSGSLQAEGLVLLESPTPRYFGEGMFFFEPRLESSSRRIVPVPEAHQEAPSKPLDESMAIASF